MWSGGGVRLAAVTRGPGSSKCKVLYSTYSVYSTSESTYPCQASQPGQPASPATDDGGGGVSGEPISVSEPITVPFPASLARECVRVRA